MPSAPRKPCRRCGKLTNGAYCEEHQKKKDVEVKAERIKYDNERGTAHSRGYGSRWTRYSKQYRIDHSLCEICLKKNIIELSECVDHIIPVVDKDDPLFWDPENHQALSKRCHDIKTATEDGGLGNKKVERFL